MKKRFITGAVVILAWAGLMVGNAVALPFALDQYTEILSVDRDNDTTVSFDWWSADGFTFSDPEYSAYDGDWTNSFSLFDAFTGGDEFDTLVTWAVDQVNDVYRDALTTSFPAPVPEPGTMIILGTCLLCLGGAASRKKKKK